MKQNYKSYLLRKELEKTKLKIKEIKRVQRIKIRKRRETRMMVKTWKRVFMNYMIVKKILKIIRNQTNKKIRKRNEMIIYLYVNFWITFFYIS